MFVGHGRRDRRARDQDRRRVFVLMIRRKLTEAEDQSGAQITAPVTAPVTPPVGEFVIQHSRIRGNKKRIRKKQLLLVLM